MERSCEKGLDAPPESTGGQEPRFTANLYLSQLDEAGKVNWVTQIKRLLMRYGFAYVWLEQQVGNSELFLSLFSQRLKDCYRQEWHAVVNESSRLRFYSTFKSQLQSERYLHCIQPNKFKISLSLIAYCTFIKPFTFNANANFFV